MYRRVKRSLFFNTTDKSFISSKCKEITEKNGIQLPYLSKNKTLTSNHYPLNKKKIKRKKANKQNKCRNQISQKTLFLFNSIRAELRFLFIHYFFIFMTSSSFFVDLISNFIYLKEKKQQQQKNCKELNLIMPKPRPSWFV